MPVEVRLPEIADGVATAKLAVWLKQVGDRVSAGEPIVEVETDKTTVEVEAPASGVVQQILVPAGAEGVAIDAVLALIADAADAPTPMPLPRGESPQAAASTASTRDAAAAREGSATRELHAVSAPPAPDHRAKAAGPETTAPSRLTAVDPAARADHRIDDVPATPLARRMAAVANLDLQDLDPSGGKITKAHIDRALGRDPKPSANAVAPTQASSAPPPAAPAPAAPAPAAPAGRFRDEPLSPARRITAARLQQSKQTIPHFYLQADCRVDALIDSRERMNRSADVNGSRITITDLIVFAAARALRAHPASNATWLENAIRRYDDVDIAVAVDTPKGLLTPVIREAQVKSLLQISRELKELSARARKGTLRPDEYSGGTFTISNLGMFNVSSITPIINPPHACILGVGGIETVAVARNDALAVGRVMALTLAADHRVIDGAEGARLLGEIRRLLEEPMALALQI